MANPLSNHGVNLPNDQQVQPELVPALHGFTPAVLDIPNNNNGWIEEEPKEDPEIEEEEEEEEEEEMDIEDEMDDPKIIYPYEIKEGELPSLPADSDTSSDSEPEVEAEDEDGDEATVGTITRASYSVPPFSGTIYVGSRSSRKVFAPGPIGSNVDMLQRKVKGLAQQIFDRANTEYSNLKRLGEMDCVSTLEDQMLEDKEEKERLKKKLRVSQQEKEQIEQAFVRRLIGFKSSLEWRFHHAWGRIERKDDENAAAKEVNAAEPTMFDDEEVTMTMDQTLIKMKSKKERILDDQMAKRLHDEEVKQATSREMQENDDFEKAKVLQQQKYQILKRKPIFVAQASKNMIVYLKNMAGYKMAHFRGMTYDQESFKKLRAEVEVSSSHSTQDTPTDDPKEMCEEDVKNMLEIVPVSEFSEVSSY
uniref:Uncharacterized protein n=1 Tax=Tanacetum cinerariifolium TaxID=118510 RepID=A0A699JG11_TANCI|nr:hypothetical protein [Tanacetum cinerariifolium]